MKKDLLSCMDITRADFERIISLAAELKEGRGKPDAAKRFPTRHAYWNVISPVS